MTEQVKDMIKHAFDGNASEFEASFDSIMADKMGVAIEDKYDQMFDAEVEETPEVEAELETEE